MRRLASPTRVTDPPALRRNEANKTGWRDIPPARLLLPRANVAFGARAALLQFVNSESNAEFNGRFVHRTYLSVIRRFVRVAR